jgi:hypothetical protein
MRTYQASDVVQMVRVLSYRSIVSSRNHVRIKRCKEMNVRAYMLLDIVDRNCEDAVQMLRSRAEVALADRLEGYPNIITIIEAADRPSLAAAIMPVLGCIDSVTEHLHLLVTRDNEIQPDLLTSSNSTPHKRKLKKASTRRKTTNSERR